MGARRIGRGRRVDSIDEDDEEELFWRSLDDSLTERDSLDDGDDVTPVTRSLLLDWHDDEVKNRVNAALEERRRGGHS